MLSTPKVSDKEVLLEVSHSTFFEVREDIYELLHEDLVLALFAFRGALVLVLFLKLFLALLI